MARVTVKDLRAEARRRLLECGNGKTISRMNKRELLEFLSCIHHPDADSFGLGGDDLGASVAGMFKEPTAQKPKKRKKKMPKAYVPVSEEPDDLSDVSFTGRGLPSTYREFVKAMLPHVRAKGLGPQAAMKTVAMMWRKHKGQRGSGLTMAGNGLTLAGAQRGMGAAGTVSDVAGGIGTALGAAGVAAGATGIGLAATPFLEAGAAAAGTVAGAAKGIDYIESLFS
jgi:hypothetical protein